MEKLEKAITTLAIGLGIGIAALVAAVAILRVVFMLAKLI